MAKIYNALTIAKYFLSIHDKDSGELVSNLKLQKLLYYAQGYWVALHGHDQPLFKDTIYAWKHGPVVDTVYHHYSEYGSDALPKQTKPKIEDQNVLSFLDEIYRTYGRFSAWVLRDMTHNETPWLSTYKPQTKNIEIPLSKLEGFFKKQIKKTR